MTSDSLKIFILAGGLGTRLQSIVKSVPKPMAPIGNRPFLDYLIDHIRSHFKQTPIYILTHHLSESIEHHYKQQSDIHIIKEPQRLGTGGAIKYAINALGLSDSPVMVLNGDTYHECPLYDFFKASQTHTLSLAYTQIQDCSRYGTLKINNNFVTSFMEKQSSETSGFINLGCYVFNASLITHSCKEKKKFSFENFLTEWINNQKQLFAYSYTGTFIDIGVPEDYQKMINYISSSKVKK